MSDLLDRNEGEMLNAENRKMAEVKEKIKKEYQKLINNFANNTFELFKGILKKHLNHSEDSTKIDQIAKECAELYFGGIKDSVKTQLESILSDKSYTSDQRKEAYNLLIDQHNQTMDDCISKLKDKNFITSDH